MRLNGVECHYRKLNPWPPGEATWAQDGDRGLGLCDTEFGRLGILICYDLSKGVVTRLKEAGATTLLYPIGWVDRDARAWFDHELPRRIGVWKLPLVGANWSLPEPPPAAHAWQGYGHSRIYSAAGTILARGAATGTEILYADLPLPDPLRLE